LKRRPFPAGGVLTTKSETFTAPFELNLIFSRALGRSRISRAPFASLGLGSLGARLAARLPAGRQAQLPLAPAKFCLALIKNESKNKDFREQKQSAYLNFSLLNCLI